MSIIFTACSQPEFVTDNSENITINKPIQETVDMVDISYGENNTLYFLINDEDIQKIYKGSIKPDGTITANQYPLFEFNPNSDILFIDYSNSMNSILVQGKTQLFNLNLNTRELDITTEKPDGIIGKMLYETYSNNGYVYTKQSTTTDDYTVIFNDADYMAEMDILNLESPELIDLSNDMTRIFYKEDNQFYFTDLSQNLVTSISEADFISQEINLGNKTAEASLFNIFKFNQALQSSVSSQNYDLVIKNGIIFDPETETIKFGYDIGLTGDTISEISYNDLQGEETIDATNLVVAPGFIDMLSFNPNYIGAKYKIGDGVTTNLSMHGCTNNFDDFFSYYERNPILVNYGGAVFMYLVRQEAGLGRYGEPNQDQIDYIAKRTREEIESGGLALAFSPEYYPGTSSDEIRASVVIAKEYDLASHFHARYSSLIGEKTNIDSVIEVLSYARELDAHVHFMHLHSTGGTGVMDDALQMIQEARDEGYEVTLDIYPYDSWATNIGSARFDGDWQGKFGITYSDIQIAGTTDFVNPDNFQQLRDNQRIVVAYAMDNNEIIMGLQDEFSMIGSDSIVTSDPSFNHFRASGAFTRFLGYYVRDLDIMPLMEGIKKTSYNAAHQLEDISDDMKVRGRITVGSIADITIFDYSTIIDTSSAETPASMAEGIEFVILSGHIIKDQEKIYTDRKFGQAIANNLK